MIVYSSLISALGRAGEWQQACAIFRRMELAGIDADVVCYNSIISACARGGSWEQAWAAFTGSLRLVVCCASYHP